MLVVGRQYALIKKCVLNSQVGLITRVYGTIYTIIEAKEEFSIISWQKSEGNMVPKNMHPMHGWSGWIN